MSAYTVRVWNNGETQNERGSAGEFEMSDTGVEAYSGEDIRMRLFEALNVNLAAIAESLDKIAAELSTSNMYRAGL